MTIARAKDIALKAGVCRQTVSAVLNGKTKKVSPQKLELILKLAKEMNYRPNPNAQSLSGHSNKTIGLLIPAYLSTILSTIIQRTQQEIFARNHTCYIVTTLDAKHQKEAIQEFCARRVDGVIIYNLKGDFEQQTCPFPVVVIDASMNNFDIGVDFAAGYKLALRHLREVHGHDKIGFLSDCHERNKEKFNAFQEEYGFVGDKQMNMVVEMRHEIDFEKRVMHLIEKEHVTAFAATGDILAGPFTNFLERRGIRVPEDIAVTGYDGTFLCFSGKKQLSSVVHPSYRLAKAGVELLFKKISSGVCNLNLPPILIKPGFFKGQSCGCDGIDFKSWPIYGCVEELLYSKIKKTNEVENCFWKEI